MGPDSALTEPDLVRVLARAEELVHRDPQLAEQLVRTCDPLLDDTPEGANHGRASYVWAQILAQRGELRRALDLINRARAALLASGEVLSALRTDLGRMHVLDDLGRHQEAVQVGRDLLAGLESLDGADDDGPSRRVHAQATENLGVAYGLLGDHESALDAYVAAEEAYRSLGMQEQSARPLANRGVELLALGRPREALAEFGRARRIFAAAGDRLFAAQCLGDTAHAHRQLGDLTEALRCLEEARLALEELGADAEAARLRLALAETYLASGLWTEARFSAELAAEATSSAGMTHDTGSACLILALADLADGDLRAAEDGLIQAEALFEQVNDRQFGARVRLARAQISIRAGERADAARRLEQVAGELEDGGWLIQLAWALLLRADLADLADSALDALERLDSAERLVRELDLPELSYQHELRRGRVLRRLGRTDGAIVHLRAAIADLDRATGAIPDYVLLTAFHSERAAAHDELIDLLVRRGGTADIREACAVADTSKARTLTDLLSQAVGTGPSLTVGSPELTEAYAELNSIYLAQQVAAQPGELEALVRRADRAEAHVGTLRLRHLGVPEQRVPRRRTAAQPSGSMPDTPTIAFHVVGGDLVVFVLTGNDVTARRVASASPRLHALLDELGDQWARLAINLALDLPHHNALLSAADATLGDLYALLLGGVEDLLSEIEGDRLRIVPHGPMGAVPFAALHDGEHYLVEQWTLTLSPTLATGRPSPPEWPADRTGRAVVVAVPDGFAPAAGAEAETVARSLPSAVHLVGSDATAAAVIRAVDGAGLVHLACHGVHRAGNPLFSRVRLADRWMTSAEVVQLSLDGALVTLSACESGTHGRNAEPIGLGWAFLAAGASGVLASQWMIDDEATHTLMASLYGHLAAGTDPAAALREAQRSTSLTYAHPYFWAAFSYVCNSLIEHKEDER